MIRAATPADAAGITDVHAAGWYAGYSHIFDQDVLAGAVEDRRTRWTDLVASPDFERSLLIVGELQGRVISFAHAGPANEHPGDLEIYSFYAHPSYWGTGVARKLMEHVLDLARARERERVYLSAYRQSGRARRFYEKLGFEETGHTTESVFDGDLEINVEYVHHLTHPQ